MRADKRRSMRLLTLGVCGFLAIVGTTCLYGVRQQALKTLDHVNEMQAEVTDFNQKAQQLNEVPYRPILHHQVNDVQQNVMLGIQRYQLNMRSMKPITQDENGETFELQCSGSWAGIACMLQDFHVKDALIGLRCVSIGTEGNQVVATVQYKVYTKG